MSSSSGISSSGASCRAALYTYLFVQFGSTIYFFQTSRVFFAFSSYRRYLVPTISSSLIGRWHPRRRSADGVSPSDAFYLSISGRRRFPSISLGWQCLVIADRHVGLINCNYPVVKQEIYTQRVMLVISINSYNNIRQYNTMYTNLHVIAAIESISVF